MNFCIDAGSTYIMRPASKCSIADSTVRYGQERAKAMLKFLLWLLLLVVCWPLALLALVLWPIVWLISLPF